MFFDDAIGGAHGEVERVHVGREDADIALAHIGHEFRRMAQSREAEERRGRCTDGHLHGADAFFDFSFRVLDRHALLGQVDVAPGMRTDGVAGFGNLLEDFRVIARVLADRKEDRLGAMVGEGGENAWRIVRPRAVIESQHHFLVAQEVVLTEMLETETRAARGVDFNRTRETDRIRIGASGLWRCALCESSRPTSRWTR